MKARGIEHRGRGRAVSPLLVEKRIGGEVNDDAKLQIQPGYLLRGRLHIGQVLRAIRSRKRGGSPGDPLLLSGKPVSRS